MFLEFFEGLKSFTNGFFAVWSDPWKLLVSQAVAGFRREHLCCC